MEDFSILQLVNKVNDWLQLAPAFFSEYFYSSITRLYALGDKKSVSIKLTKLY